MTTVRGVAHSRREAWLLANMEITSAVLAGTGAEGLWSLIAHGAHAASEADRAVVALPTDDPGWLRIAAAVGDGTEEQLGLAVRVISRREPLLWEDMGSDERVYPPQRSFGPAMVVPIVDPEGVILGWLGVFKLRDRPGFDDQDVAMLSSFAAQAVLARRLDEMRMVEERDRIAHDLHGHVVQELFATSITLQGIAATAGTEPAEQQRRRMLEVVRTLDDVIGTIRATIFGLRPLPIPHQPAAAGVRQQVQEVIEAATGTLGFQATLRFNGSLELVTPSMAADLVAVVREALSNVARHARATAVTVELSANGTELTVRVADNGQGIGDTTRRSGLRNLRVRAERHHGTLSVVSRAGAGTSLTWAIPLHPRNIELGDRTFVTTGLSDAVTAARACAEAASSDSGEEFDVGHHGIRDRMARFADRMRLDATATGEVPPNHPTPCR
jgi:two-component system sensor histidine kinase DevS